MMSTLPSQATLKNAWKSDEVKVTCLVICYNHQDYIFDCLKGIVSQKTDFAFKVVVYDDFSTDDTRKVLRDFEKHYPDIFDIYYANFNHYGVAQKEEHLDKLEGDYIAMCEGDDYWIDNLKLKKQYEEINKRGAFFCVHPAVIFFEEARHEDVFCYYGNRIKMLPQKLIFGLKNQFAPTASYFISLEKYREYTEFRKKLKGGPGDFFMEVLASDEGIVYLPDIMSSYRRGSTGSHSQRQSVLSIDDIYSDLERWSINIDALIECRPNLEKYMIEKKTLVEFDCLLKICQLVNNTSGKEKSQEYMEKATLLLRSLGPLEY
ncbi:MAG: glycosyltransferase family 2 protein [Pseudomonadota bacterium]